MVEGNINVKQFPEHDLKGWWNKMQLFHPGILPGDTFIYGFRCSDYR